jgi:hypothetical protein
MCPALDGYNADADLEQLMEKSLVETDPDVAKIMVCG